MNQRSVLGSGAGEGEEDEKGRRLRVVAKPSSPPRGMRWGEAFGERRSSMASPCNAERTAVARPASLAGTSRR